MMSITQILEGASPFAARADQEIGMDPNNATAHDSRIRPALLVSVRNAAEALSAIEGGCDIIDVKEPARGSLGRADAAEIEEVFALCRERNVGLPVSVALGEAVDADNADGIDPICIGSERGETTVFKLGTAGLGGTVNWWKSLREARRRWETDSIIGLDQQLAQWVAVAYADWSVARSPAPRDVLAAIADAGWSGLLIDTFDKSGGGLFNWQREDELRELAAGARDHKLWFALAGRLTVADLQRLIPLAPDVVGIRTAACRDEERNGVIDPTRVQSARDLLGRGRLSCFLTTGR